ncbi:MAG: hypothetical protein LBM78_02050 [Clostridiales bacterium]|nr:hypothetical protein [Clostridiales bacterium]
MVARFFTVLDGKALYKIAVQSHLYTENETDFYIAELLPARADACPYKAVLLRKGDVLRLSALPLEPGAPAFSPEQHAWCLLEPIGEDLYRLHETAEDW